MTTAAESFDAELTRVLDYFRSEFNLTYSEAIGVLHIRMVGLANEALELESEFGPDADDDDVVDDNYDDDDNNNNNFQQ